MEHSERPVNPQAPRARTSVPAPAETGGQPTRPAAGAAAGTAGRRTASRRAPLSPSRRRPAPGKPRHAHAPAPATRHSPRRPRNVPFPAPAFGQPTANWAKRTPLAACSTPDNQPSAPSWSAGARSVAWEGTRLTTRAPTSSTGTGRNARPEPGNRPLVGIQDTAALVVPAPCPDALRRRIFIAGTAPLRWRLRRRRRWPSPRGPAADGAPCCWSRIGTCWSCAPSPCRPMPRRDIWAEFGFTMTIAAAPRALRRKADTTCAAIT